MNKKFKIRRNDTVEVIAGKDKGKRGVVIRILRKKDSVIVQGVNMVKKTVRRKSQQDSGGIIDIEAPIHISNVMIVSKKGEKTRVGYKIVDDKKVRVCRKSGDEL